MRRIFEIITTSLIVIGSIYVYCYDVCSATNPDGVACTCNSSLSLLIVDCRRKMLVNIPEGLPRNATTMILSNNNLRELSQGSFGHFINLLDLILQNNSISTIEPGAFNHLMRLTEIILSDNLLTVIEEGIFDHLPALQVLNLSKNRIKSIKGRAFFALPNLTLLELTGNLLYCECEELKLRQFCEIHTSLICQATCKNFNNTSLMAVQIPKFRSCSEDETLFTRSMSCYTCSDAADIRDCGNQTQALCNGQTPVCYTHVNYSDNQLGVSGGCAEYLTCLIEESKNSKLCSGDNESASCYFCTPETLSNNNNIDGVLREFGFTALITLSTKMTQQLADPGSSTYYNFTRNLATEVNNQLKHSKGACTAKFVDLRAPNVTIAMAVYCVTMWYVKNTEVSSEMTQTLSSTMFNGHTVQTLQVIFANISNLCQHEITQDITYGFFEWPPTAGGLDSIVLCPYQLSGPNNTMKTASRLCDILYNGTVSWQVPNITECTNVNEHSDNLQNMAESSITNDNVEEVSTNLNDLSSKWQDFGTEDVKWSIEIISGILNTTASTSLKSVIYNTWEVINNLLNIDVDVLKEAHSKYKTSARLLILVERFLSGITVTLNDYKEVKNNIAGIVTAVTSSTFDGLSMSYNGTGGKSLKDSEVYYNKSEIIFDNLYQYSGIVLPNTLLKSLPSQTSSSVKKIVLTLFKEPKLFASIHETNETRRIIIGGESVEVVRKINSHVISASLPLVEVKNLTKPIKIALLHILGGENPSCVFWNTAIEKWSPEGCVVNKTEANVTTCYCNHLTNFALLMDVYGTAERLSVGNSMALSLISYIGCAISLVAICLTMLTYLKFRKLRRDNPSKILLNLCGSIGLVDIVFLIGMQSYSSENKTGCKVVAILLHYLLLSAMCWMAIEAFYMYLTLVKVFDTYIARFQLKSALFGWGIPLVIVGITLGIQRTDNYGLQPRNICWLNKIPFYAAFVGPVCAILVFNTVVYILVLCKILNRNSKELTKTDYTTISVRLRGAVSLIVLLGLTWLFAIFAFTDFGIVFLYLFAAFNSLQGFFIFIFYCVLKKDAQTFWRRFLPCCKSPYEQSTTTTNTKVFAGIHQQENNTVNEESKTTPAVVFRGRWQVQIADSRPTKYA